MKLTIETITPAIAAKMLAKNPNNRNIRPIHVGALANEMASGRWQLTSQGISIDVNGDVVDGQHRLSAIIKSGVTIQCVVARGVDPETLTAYDMGAKRTIADALHLKDGLMNATKCCASSATIIHICFNTSIPMSLGMARRVIAEYGQEIQDCVHYVNPFKPAAKSWLYGSLAFAMRHDKSVRAFAESFGIGEGLTKGHPALALRNWFINGGADVKLRNRNAAFESVFNALYAHSKGNTLTVIRTGRQGIDFYRNKSRVFTEAMRRESQIIKSSAKVFMGKESV